MKDRIKFDKGRQESGEETGKKNDIGIDGFAFKSWVMDGPTDGHDLV